MHRARARLWDARQPKAGQEVACASVPEWLDWHPARPELAVLDRAGTLTVADARRAGKPLSKRKTDCEARPAPAVPRAARSGAATRVAARAALRCHGEASQRGVRPRRRTRSRARSRSAAMACSSSSASGTAWRRAVSRRSRAALYQQRPRALTQNRAGGRPQLP